MAVAKLSPNYTVWLVPGIILLHDYSLYPVIIKVVILSVAKDLIFKILRCAQNDRFVVCIAITGLMTRLPFINMGQGGDRRVSNRQFSDLTPGTLEIYLMGPPHLKYNGTQVDLARKKERALLFYLGMADRMVARNVLADLLWGGLPEEKALHGLSNAVYRINRSITPAAPNQSTTLLTGSRDSVGFNPQFPVFIDALALEVLAGNGREENPASLEEVITLYRGDFLEGFFIRQADEFEKWSLEQRERLQVNYLSALYRLLHRAMEAKDYNKALDYAHQALNRDELQEDIHCVIMQLHWLSGKRAAALRQYQVCSQLLRKELGVEPQSRTRALYDRISAGEAADGAGAAPPAPSAKENSRPAGFLLSVNENRGQAFFNLGEYDRAAKEFNSMQQLAAGAGDTQLGSKATYLLGLTNLCNRDFSPAEKNLAGAYQTALAGGDTRLAVSCVTGLSLMYSMAGRLEEARKFSDLAQKLGRETNDDDSRCHALIDIGRRLLLKGRASTAVAGLVEALLLSQNARQIFNELFARFFLGLAYAEQGSFMPAIEQLTVNLAQAQQVGNSFMLTRLPNSIGYVYHELGDLDSAAAWNERGVEICRQYPWPEPLGYSLVNLAFDCLYLGDQGRARSLLREAEKLAARDTKVTWRWESRVWLGLGELALQEGNAPQARRYYDRAYSCASQTRVRKNVARSLLFQGKIHYLDGAYDEAAASASEALIQAGHLENPLLLFYCHESLAAAYRALGASEVARRHTNLAAEIVKTICHQLEDRQTLIFKTKLHNSSINGWGSRDITRRT